MQRSQGSHQTAGGSCLGIERTTGSHTNYLAQAQHPCSWQAHAFPLHPYGFVSRLLCAMQVIGDMIINNESRIARSKVVSHFNKARQYSMTIALRWVNLLGSSTHAHQALRLDDDRATNFFESILAGDAGCLGGACLPACCFSILLMQIPGCRIPRP